RSPRSSSSWLPAAPSCLSPGSPQPCSLSRFRPAHHAGRARNARDGAATALRRRANGLLVLVVLRCALDRRYPALAPLHPDLGFGLQLEGRLIQTSGPNLDERVVGLGWVKE